MRWRIAGWTGAVAVMAVCAIAGLVAGLLVPPQSLAARDERAGPPRRIVSINLCTDQLLLDIVPRKHIAALSRLAADPALSAVTDRIAGIELLRGTAEEVLAQAPDLVLTSEYSTPQLVSLLRRLGVRVETIPLASDIEGVRAAIRKVAAAVGEEARGREVIAALDARIASSTATDPLRPTALAWQVNSLTAGPGGLIDAMMAAAGFRNMASEHRLGPAGRLPLEAFVAHPPDLVVLATPPDAYATRSADNLRHPAMRELTRKRPTAAIEMPLWLCGTPAVAEGIARLARERRLMAGSIARAAEASRQTDAQALRP